MKFHHTFRLLTVAAICALFLVTPRAQSADNGAAGQNRDAQSVLNQMRLKKWTKDLTLSAEQQKKVQALLDEEGKQIAKLEDQNLSPLDRSAKVGELHEGTYAKVKPLLSATQLETFEKILAKSAKPKKTKPAAESPKQ